MSRVSLSFTDDGMKYRKDDGTLVDAQSEPFQVLTRLRRWKPICIKHKLIFKNRQAYNAHWTSVCEQFKTSEVPASDYKKHLKGYSNA